MKPPKMHDTSIDTARERNFTKKGAPRLSASTVGSRGEPSAKPMPKRRKGK